MTRYTSLAYKRTHFEAGFDEDSDLSQLDADSSKKRKVEPQETKGWGRDNSIKNSAAKTEMRRQKRVQEREANTTCFACRGQGHTAKDCPAATMDSNEKSRPSMGICYRCGSTKHSLKRCRKPEDPENALPFATCFICSAKGHLAGSCSKNAKGVYPNGGNCVLCGKATHLARDCDLRKQTLVDHAIMTGQAKSNPDEDDFHAFKRQQMHIEKSIKLEERQQLKLVPVARKPTSAAKPKIVAF